MGFGRSDWIEGRVGHCPVAVQVLSPTPNNALGSTLGVVAICLPTMPLPGVMGVGRRCGRLNSRSTLSLLCSRLLAPEWISHGISGTDS